LIAFKGDQDIFVAHEALTSQAIMRRHVVDLGILGLGLSDLPELLQQLLLLLRQGIAYLTVGLRWVTSTRHDPHSPSWQSKGIGIL